MPDCQRGPSESHERDERLWRLQENLQNSPWVLTFVLMMVPIEFPEALHFYGPMLGTSVASPSASRPYHTIVVAVIMCFIR
jgi:uncharacterized membrane protein (DUF485 family)